MRRRVLDFLESKSGNQFALKKGGATEDGDIGEGELISENGESYLIMDGVPRFTGATRADVEKTRSAFSLEWKYSQEDDRNWGQSIEDRVNLFLKGMDVQKRDLQGKIIFDAGCGSGKMARLFADQFDMEVLGLDLSSSVFNAYKRNQNPNVYFIQASLLDPPIRSEFADYVYAAGCLHHTGNTWLAFERVLRALKRGGRILIWLYHPIDRRHHPNDLTKMYVYYNLLRPTISRLPQQVQESIYLTMVIPFLLKQKAKRMMGSTAPPLNFREKIQIFADTFSPVYVDRYSEEDAIREFKRFGLKNVEIGYQEEYGFSIRGDKL